MNDQTIQTNPIEQNERAARPAQPTRDEFANAFRDADGELSFYVQNVSDGDIVLSGSPIQIPFLGVSDLREYLGTEDLKKLPSLREALSGRYKMLKRIDKATYDRLLAVQSGRAHRIAEHKRKVIDNAQNKALANEQNKVIETKVDISPKVYSMVEKLKLYYKGQNTSITPEDFHIFVEACDLTLDEREYIMSVVKEDEIRKVVARKAAS